MKLNKMIQVFKTVLLVACGVLLLVFPSTSADTLSYIAGGLMALYGAVNVLLFFSRREAEGSRMAHGALTAVFGLYMVLRPALFGQLIPTLLTFVLLACALRSLQTGVKLKRMASPHAKVQLIVSGAVAAYALLLLAVPFSQLWVNYLFIGAGYVLSGVADLALWIVRHRKKKEKKEAQA